MEHRPFFAFVIALALSLAGFVLLRRSAKASTLIRHHHLVEPILSLVGTLFAILLGFLVSFAMSNYQVANNCVANEANALCDVFRFSLGLPNGLSHQLRDTCREYNDIVLSEEWTTMEKRHSSPKAWGAYYKLWDEVLAFKPTTNYDNNIHQCILNATQRLGENRRSRIALMEHQTPLEMWLVVFLGAATIVVLTYLFASRGVFIHSFLIAIVTFSLCLNISLLLVYNSPFQGNLKIKPSGFYINREMFLQNDNPK